MVIATREEGAFGAPKLRRDGAIYDALNEHWKALGARQDRAMARQAVAYKRAAQQVEQDLQAMTRKIAEARAAGETVGPSWLYRQDRYRSLLQQAKDSAAEFSQSAQEQIESLQRQSAAEGIRAAEQLAKKQLAVMPPGLNADDWTKINKRAAEAMTAYVDKSRSPLRGILAQMPDVSGTQMHNALQKGIILGWGTDKIAREARAGFASTTLRRAQTIARTESHRAYRAAQQTAFAINPAVKGWTWVAKLDRRTCAVCWSMHGQVFEKQDFMHSHPNCRCAMVPKTKTWEELGFQGVRGTAVDIPSGQGLFAALSEAEQRRILGPTRLEMFKGGMPLADFVKVTPNSTWGPQIGLTPLARTMPTGATGTPAAPGPVSPATLEALMRSGTFDVHPERLAEYQNSLKYPRGRTPEEILAANTFVHLGGGINDTWTAYIGGQKVVVKAQDRRSVRTSIRAGAGSEREVSAYQVSAWMKDNIPGYGLDAPVTVLRNIPHIGDNSMVMAWVENGVPAFKATARPIQIDADQMALLDSVIANTDRHQGNYMYVNGRIVPIDHGLAFPTGADVGNTDFTNRARALTDAEVKGLNAMLADDALQTSLKDLLPPKAYTEYVARVKYMASNTTTITQYDLRTRPWAAATVVAPKLNPGNIPPWRVPHLQRQARAGWDRNLGGAADRAAVLRAGGDLVLYQNDIGYFGDVRWEDLPLAHRMELAKQQGMQKPLIGQAFEIVTVRGLRVIARRK